MLGSLLCIAALCAGCGKKASEEAVQTQVPTIQETTTQAAASAPKILIQSDEEKKEDAKELPEYILPEEREEKDGMIRSFLTGQMVPAEQADRRPIAIMMSNDKEARPQYGINRAGVVYEAPVEANMNRYMAVIEDYDDLDRIGSVRSCRTYYTYFAREFDAIYAHYGQSTFAKPYLKNVDNINGLDAIGGTAYYRSKDKRSPHNAYTSGDRLKKSINTLGYTTEYDDSYKGHVGDVAGVHGILTFNGFRALNGIHVSLYTFSQAVKFPVSADQLVILDDINTTGCSLKEQLFANLWSITGTRLDHVV
jgi:hypothetical protein